MDSRKLLQSILILVIAGLALSGFADRVSGDYAEQALTRALTTYAIARTLNGVISVAQGTEIAVEPAGVGVTMTPGQILDPVNDLIERFSSVMLVAASSIGLQLLLLEILSSIVMTLAVLAGLTVWFGAIWSEPVRKSKYTAPILRLAAVVLFARFVVPVVIIGSNLIFDAFLVEKHDQAAIELQGTTREVQELSDEYRESNEQEAAPEQADPIAESSGADSGNRPDMEGIATRMTNAIREWYDDLAESLEDTSVSARINNLRNSAANVTSHIVDLIVVFVLQTILVPLLFLWLFMEAIKAIVARGVKNRV
jgi:hypothetical protein